MPVLASLSTMLPQSIGVVYVLSSASKWLFSLIYFTMCYIQEALRSTFLLHHSSSLVSLDSIFHHLYLWNLYLPWCWSMDDFITYQMGITKPLHLSAPFLFQKFYKDVILHEWYQQKIAVKMASLLHLLCVYPPLIQPTTFQLQC